MPATLPAVLVTTDWVAQHATDTGVRVVEVDVDTTSYDQGHVPGSAGWNWTTELCDTLVRDIVPAGKLEQLLGNGKAEGTPDGESNEEAPAKKKRTRKTEQEAA